MSKSAGINPQKKEASMPSYKSDFETRMNVRVKFQEAVEASNAAKAQKLWRGFHVDGVEFNSEISDLGTANSSGIVSVIVPAGREVHAIPVGGFTGKKAPVFEFPEPHCVSDEECIADHYGIPVKAVEAMKKDNALTAFAKKADPLPKPNWDELTKNLGHVRATTSVSSHFQQFGRVMRKPAKRNWQVRAADSIRNAWWSVSGHLAFVLKSALGALIAWAVVAIAVGVL